MSDRRPLIAIAVHNGFAIRYLLRTDIATELIRLGASLLVLAPNADEPYFRTQFERPHVELARLDAAAYSRYRLRSRLLLACELLRVLVLNGKGDLTAIHVRRQRLRAKVHGWTQRLRWAFVQPAAWLLQRSRLLRILLMRVESRLFTPDTHRAILENARPDLLVVAGLGFWAFDAFLMREARQAGIRVASVMLSWDNPSTKGLGAGRPDLAVAWTEAMKRELVTYHDIPEPDVFVGGVAHFDAHVRRDPAPAADDVLARLGCAPGRRVIYFATASPTAFHAHNREVVEAVGAALRDRCFVVPSQMIVRIHPLYLGRGVRRDAGERIEELRTLAAHFPHVVLDIPETKTANVGFDLPEADSLQLRALLRVADVVLTPFSTLMLEAALFDVPIINTAFETPNVELQSTNRLPEEFPHLRRAIDTGGTRQAHSAGELIVAINDYLRDRSRDARGRQTLRDQECGPNAGHAGAAVAARLFGFARGT